MCHAYIRDSRVLRIDFFQISEFMGKTFQATYSTTHQRSVEVQFGRYQKIFCRSDLWSKISRVLIVQLATFLSLTGPFHNPEFPLAPTDWEFRKDNREKTRQSSIDISPSIYENVPTAL